MPLQIALYNSRVGVQYKQPSRGYTCYTNSNLVAILVCSLGDAYCAIIIIYSFSMIDCSAFNLTYFKLYMFAGLQTGLKCTDKFLLGRYPLSPFWGILRRCQKSLSNSFPCHRKRTNAGQSYWGGFSVRGNNSFPVIFSGDGRDIPAKETEIDSELRCQDRGVSENVRSCEWAR